MRTIQIEDDEFDDLQSEKEDLEDRVTELESALGETQEDLESLQSKWDDKTELLKRIGELS